MADSEDEYKFYADQTYEPETPRLDQFVRKSDKSQIFRISKKDLTLFFQKKNMSVPDNQGECRSSLNILRECGYS